LGQRRVGGTRHGHWVMSLHKLTAGDGYTYLTRQVAAADATHRGRDGLGEYYSQRGESPGIWMGHGAGGLTEFLAPTEAAAAAVGDRSAGAGLAQAAGAAGAFRGAEVSETQMLALFGQGRHPNAEAIEKAMITGGQGVRAVLSATRLGAPYKVVKGPSAFRVELARRFEQSNAGAGLPRDWPVPEAERAAIRTGLGREMFTGQYGRAPSNSRELSGFLARAMRQQTTAVAGYDLTFTPVKSVSALWAVAPRDVAQVIERAHQTAVEQCLSWLEDNAAYTRLGRGGARQVDVRGLIAAAFTHRDSRAGDPNLHTHVAVSNKVQAVGGQAAGRWLALDGRPLHKLAVAASERYNTRLEALLRDRLGVEFTERAGEPGKRAVREIVGVDERLLTTWSARRLMIDLRRGELAGQFQARHGRPPGPIEAVKLAQQATLETRQAKHEPRSHAEQRQTWRADALGVLGTPHALAAMVDGALQGLRERSSQRHDRQQASIGAAGTLDTPGWVAGTAEQVLATVQTNRATWQQAHVRAEAERAVRTANLPLARVDAAVEAIVAAALSPASSLPLGMPEPVSEPAALRRRDGTSVYTTAGAQLFTSPNVVAAEQALLALSMRSGGRTVSAESVELALLEAAATGVVLNPGQVAMVREFTGSGSLMQLALAPAGTGKTVTMSVVSGAWKGDGGNVLGLAPSAAAAAILGQELSGAAPGSVHSDTLAKLIFSLDTLDQQAGPPGRAGPRGPVPAWVHQIGPGTLVILDEAGMAGTVELARAAEWLTDRGAVLRLVGDDAQLAAVGAGGVLRDIAETAGALTLSQVVRFTDPAEGAASLALRAGVRAAIGFYLDNDRVHVGDPATGVDAAYHAWTTDRSAGKDSLMLAPTRAVAAELNARARADRLATGTPDGPRGDAEVRLSGGSAASAGDTVVTRRNNRRLALSTSDWVKNGDRFTVRDVLPGGAVTVQHQHTRRVITLPADYARQHLALGYASTVHAAQGATADTCHTVATGAEDRRLLYVAMTRGRTSNHLYLATAGDGDEQSVLTPDALLPPTAVDLLTRILDRDGAQVSATTAQAQLADPAVRLGAAADRYHDSLHVAALHRLGKAGLAALDRAAEQTLPGLSDAPAWTTLRASLALHAATDTRHDPSPDPSPDGATDRQLLAVQAATQVLHQALRRGEVRSAADPAAVLDWRLDLTDPSRTRPTGALTGTTRTPGPLPWLPAIPPGLEHDRTWGIYLQARHGYTTYLAEQVAERARAWTPTSAPAWAAPLLGADGAGDLLADLAVWRAANNVTDNDLTPTGPRRLPAPDAREQNALGARVTRTLGDPAAAAHRWRTLAQQLEPRLLADPYWPVLADRLAAAARAGIDVDALVRHASTANRSPGSTLPDSTLPDGPAPLPDEMPAAALWWRLSRQLAPAALHAQASDLGAGSTAVPPTLRPAWTGHLTVLFGNNLGARIVADPAWPALVAAVTQAVQAGWTPEQVLTTTHELLYDTHHAAASATGDSAADCEGAPATPRAGELTTALVWRVAMLTDTPVDTDHLAGRADTPRDDDVPVEVENAPLDPYEQDLLPPEDLYDGLDESPDRHSAVDLPDELATRQLPHFGDHLQPTDTVGPAPDHHDDALSHPSAQHPAAELDETPTNDLAQHRQTEPDAPDWPALAPAHDQAAGQEQLWQADAGSEAEHEAGSAVTAPVAKERLLELNAQAAGFYAGAYRGSWAQQHLQQRLGTDLTGDPRFTPGYAPAGWTHLVEHLRARGATDPELLQAGLATQARTGRLIDRFRDRLVLPIQTLPIQTLPSQTVPSAAAPAADPTGGQAPGHIPLQVIGFVGRRHPDAVDDQDGYCPAGPTYLNTADSLVFSKGAQLYGLAEGAAALAAGAVPVLVEGPLDALAVTLAAGGDAVGVAPLGTAFTDLQADSLRPYLPGQPADPTITKQTTQAAGQAAGQATKDPHPTPGVIVGTDADNAGRKAAIAAYWKLVARGANPGHLTLPDGLDPAELLSTAGPEALRAAIAAARAGDSTLARTVVTDRVAGYADQLHTAEGTVHAIRAAAKVIGALPPQHWAAHIAHLDTLVDAAGGLTGLEVLDAALTWAGDPHNPRAAARRAAACTAEIVPQVPGSRPAAPQPPDKAPTWPTYLTDTAPTPARTSVAARDTAGGPATEVADGPTERITAQWAAKRWRDVGLALDPRLVAGRDWPRLAVTLELASRTGYNIQQHLPRLAAVEPLPDEQPASALRSRLLREVPQARSTATPQVRRAADRQRIADAAAARAGNKNDPARRDPGPSAPGRGPGR